MSLDHHHDEQGDELLKSEDFQKARREMRRVLWKPGVKPDNQVSITRRIFLNRALLAGTAAAADIELPDQLAWTAYDTGSAGYNQAVAIGSAI